MASDDAVQQEGRNATVTVKTTLREQRAAAVVAEIRDIGVSTLLHGTTIAAVVEEYDRFIDMARKAS